MSVCDSIPIHFLFEANWEIPDGAEAPGWLYGSTLRPAHVFEIERFAFWCFQTVWERGADGGNYQQCWLGSRQRNKTLCLGICNLRWWLSGLLKLQDAENRVTFERRARNICSCIGNYGCDLDHNHLFMASSMSVYNVIVLGFISCKRCSFSQRCRSFETFVMQNFVRAGFSHAKTFAGEISDGSIESCRCCHEKTQRSKARVVMLIFGYLERKQSWRSNWPREHLQTRHKSKTTGLQPGTGQPFD